jgi:hypothetical protein
MSGSLMSAKLVWDGGDEVRIPASMGTPRGDQMRGTAAERLTELAGRICYDSLGKGRPSFRKECCPISLQIGPIHSPDCRVCGGSNVIEGYHDHITAVGHGSVREHFNFTVEFKLLEFTPEHLQCLLNRPGIYVRVGVGEWCGGASLQITTNIRAAFEWFAKRADRDRHAPSPQERLIGHVIQGAATQLAPEIMAGTSVNVDEIADLGDVLGVEYRIIEPQCDEQAWVSLYMSGSRGFSHEQVRHGDWTAISQRSTRYVDESESPWIEHPLIEQYIREEIPSPITPACIESAQSMYVATVAHLEPWLIARGVDKGTARKQARGAARGYLGNALQTEMIFSASVAQWKWMLRQRCSVHADAEIRIIYNDVLRELKSCRYSEAFAGMELIPSPDGIGCVLAETVPAKVA